MKIKTIVLIAIILPITLCINASMLMQLDAAKNAVSIAQINMMNALGMTKSAQINSRKKAISDKWYSQKTIYDTQATIDNNLKTAQNNSRNKAINDTWSFANEIALIAMQAQRLLVTAQINSRMQATISKWLADYNTVTNATLLQQLITSAQANSRNTAIIDRWNTPKK